MRIAGRYIASLSLVAISFTTICSAGPGFNSERRELALLSRDAGAALQRGLANMHLMLESLELDNPQQAEQRRADALKEFELAVKSFQKISEMAPKQKLVFDPRTDAEKLAVESFAPALKRRNMEVPATEKELAQLAEKLVSDFRSTVAESPRFDKNSRRAYGYFQTLFRDEGFLLNVGINASIIWSIQEAGPR